MTHEERLDRDRSRVEDWLRTCFLGRQEYARLYESMNYSLLAGGKRVRPVLTLETCRLFGGDTEAALPFACAVEMLHTYSLIHDDLPGMDNDDLRRGKPTNHRLYGQAGAILAGDALLTAAFETMAEHPGPFSRDKVLGAIECLGRAAGARGMVGGQALDMAAEGKALSAGELETLQSLKTGALLRAAAEIGCILAGGTPDQLEAVRTYAEKLGLAFQIRDDILDETGDTAALGKPAGSDRENGKSTFVTCLGLPACQARVEELTRQAAQAVSVFPGHEFLTWFAGLLALRAC